MKYKNLTPTALFTALLFSVCHVQAETAPSEFELGVLESGMVTEVKARPGQQVKQGALLLKLDQRRQRTRLAAAKALLAKAEAEHHEARRELERVTELHEQTLISIHEMERAKVLFSAAVASLKSAEADLMDATVALENTELRAPFDGKVSAVLVYPGQAVRNDWQITPLLKYAR